MVDHVRKGDAKREDRLAPVSRSYAALEHYRQAGDGLLRLKAFCRDTGRGFKELIGLTTRAGEVDFTYRRACHLMKLANEWPVDWERWQEICGNKKPARFRRFRPWTPQNARD